MPFPAQDHGCTGWSGEMARRISEFDWAATGVGAIADWPRSLTATVQLLLASPVPLVLLWGRSGYMIYNDAYAVFAGGRHPYLLGCPVETGWPEVAEFNRHVMTTCLAGGTLSYRDKELVLLREGKPEDVWMDLYYSPVADDSGAPAGVLAVVVETTGRVLTERWRQRAEAELHETNERLQLALNTGAVLGTCVVDMQTGKITGDERFARTFSFSVEEAAGGVDHSAAARMIHPDDQSLLERLSADALQEGKPFRAEYRIRRPDGDYVWVQANGQCEFDEHGQPTRLPAVLIDIHERKIAEQSLRQLTETLEQRVADAVAARALAEEQLRQAQKMEAIGSLTGGVAHDFNNVLQVINGNLQMMAADASGNPATLRRLSAATDAVKRGAKLAAHLLAFARRQPLSPTVLNPRRLLAGMSEMLHRALGETMRIETVLSDHLWHVQVDRNQLENALLNLAINARDAMKADGTLTVRAANRVLDAAFCSDKPELSPGEYVVFSVTDTGAGMPPDVLEHAFEPFFTTKPHGHGTGLGLSMVFGFVRQSGGHTLIESELGRGTTVSLFFPRCCEPETAEAADETSAPVGGGETVLVVEDDADVRLTAVEMLVQLGYKVLTASSGDAALEFIDSDVPIDLLFTDVVMPGKIKSVELARRAAARSPSVPTLFTSGYTRDEIVHHGKLDAGITLLSKPYRRDDLARKVRGVLRAAAGGAGGTAAVGKMTDREIAACVPSVAYDPASGDASGVATSGVATSGVDAPGLATPLTPTPKAAANESESASTDAPARSPAHVLLVEDDADSREALSCLLGALGLDCTSVGSAEEALPLLPAQRYDILFTDITLPGMSGDNLARAVLREQPDVQVLLVSGYGAQAPIGERIPGARLLGKPFDLAQLRRELAQWVNPIEAAS
ncbi:PAS domain S-box-containing protein [Paraburkholderia sp. GV068]|uniref:response regulator n=1 Tax=unclassified Paraburkholderia TaxID=2615204 RepID=UPI000D31FC5A|nr:MULTISPECIES: response regulator [unclassified Paraburkholderia]PTQ97251.1 PAS domain S-box-containing protein [Paraburkholderia sp. GV072]PUB02790.1 PAS domain S-box-containing protein [Paraburkholderia sp. GV068]